MRFLRESKAKKTILVISDIHLGAGAYVEGRRNYLEDFHYDREMVDFLKYHSSGDYEDKEVELVINGDLFDFLAVPFVRYFDDEYWSEEAAIDKLKMIMNGHPEVMEAFKDFVQVENKSIVYIIGNHDAEFVFDSIQKLFLEQFSENTRDRIKIIINVNESYKPAPGVAIIHGHEYEMAHSYEPESSIAVDSSGKKYFIPSWGSYYVTRILNKFKGQRIYVNAVQPIKKFIINGIIYDTLFTIRFAIASLVYFFMVRFIFIFKQIRNFQDVWNYSLKEMALWKDYEDLTRDFFCKHKDIHTLIVGHTHDPAFKPYGDGTTFINTGTWTKMSYLEFGRPSVGPQLTYAKIEVPYGSDGGPDSKPDDKSKAVIALNEWKGFNPLPFCEFS